MDDSLLTELTSMFQLEAPSMSYQQSQYHTPLSNNHFISIKPMANLSYEIDRSVDYVFVDDHSMTPSPQCIPSYEYTLLPPPAFVPSESSPLIGSDFGLHEYTQWAFCLPPPQQPEMRMRNFKTPPPSPLRRSLSPPGAPLINANIKRENRPDSAHSNTSATGEFPCKSCDKVFSKSWRLRTHMVNVHDKVRPYACKECDMAFRSPYDLRRHETTHTGERFECDMCLSSFGSKQRVANHLKNSEPCWPRHGRPLPEVRRKRAFPF
uniref:C2H2-type domain-containing protein n=1 Tax=Plectus sambesii TaxID=2011161 RepID=A0A914X819_9BILA